MRFSGYFLGRAGGILAFVAAFASLALGQGALTPPGAPAPSFKTLTEVEPRAHITSLPYIISLPGSYYLATNLNGGGATVGILVQASGVTIDLRGFSIANCSTGITATTGVRNLAVQNGFVRNCSGAGIELTAAAGCRMQGVTVAENGGHGAVAGAGSAITFCVAAGNGGIGFGLGDGSEIYNCVAQSNATSGIVLTANSQVRDNTCLANGGGAGQGGIVLLGDNNRAEGNACNRNNGFGFRVVGANNFVVRNNACGNTTLDYSINAGNHYGQVLISPGAAFSGGNSWANFACSAAPGFCQVNADCSDTNACTTDTCVNNACVFTATTCSDGNSCTTDSCNPATGCVFANVVNGASCNDNNVCTTGDTCNNGICTGSAITCPDDGNICTTAVCNPTLGCVQQNNTALCDDGNLCTTNDICSNGICAGTPKTCNDNNPCTTDSCNSATGACQFVNNTASCSDGNPCTTGDICSNGVCQPGTGSLNCNDNNSCTTDSCSPAAGCVHANVTNGTTCSDNSVCTTGDACNNGVCTGSAITCPDDSNPCTTPVCNAASGCGFVFNSNSCDDGNPCTINDRCSSGVCAGSAKSCSDNNPCTTDACDSQTGNCFSVNNTAACSDGNACTVGDVCGGGVCQPGASTLNCNDNNPCTVDACDSVAGCTHANVADLTPCAGGYCQSGACVTALANGATCTIGSQCASGFCVDSVCCNSICNSTCVACTAAKKGSGANGTCGNIVAGTDPDNECNGILNCNGNGVCQ